MSGEYLAYLWQHEYNKRWINYSTEDCETLNSAVAKHQKTTTLKSENKKLNINFEKMIQRNTFSGYEQRLRCVGFNGAYFCWNWKDDFDKWNSYSPYVSLYLEVALEKKLETVEISLKTSYMLNLRNFTQRNVTTGHIRDIIREEVDMADAVQGNRSFRKICLQCNNLIEMMSTKSEQSIKNILSNLPMDTPSSTENRIEMIEADEQLQSLSSLPSTSQKVPTQEFKVDKQCPEARDCDLYCENSIPYSATLSLTNLRANNNKFFIIQLLKYKGVDEYAIWYRWGRTGYKGQTKLTSYGNKLAECKKIFKKKFYDKTCNDWDNASNFSKHPSKYDLVYVDPSSEVQVPEAVLKAESKLDKRIQNLLELICNRNNLDDAAKEMCYDSVSCPLGAITAEQIREGYTALAKIVLVLQTEGVGESLVEACNTFYTKIPHNFGRKTPPVMVNLIDVSKKMKMLEELSNIREAMDFMSSAEGAENVIDKYYKSLECDLSPVERDGEEFNAIKKCLAETHGPTHVGYKMEVIEVFKCCKDSKQKAFADFGNKRLLWHGSRLSNWISILKKGLEIAPPEAPSTGYMFGKGIYFADVASKSANYCLATKRKNDGLLLLSEVSLGQTIEAHHSMDFSSLPSAFHSVSGIGCYKPARFINTVLSSDATLPCGPLEEVDIEELSLKYNEYIVYDAKQVRMKYLVRIKFQFC